MHDLNGEKKILSVKYNLTLAQEGANGSSAEKINMFKFGIIMVSFYILKTQLTAIVLINRTNTFRILHVLQFDILYYLLLKKLIHIIVNKYINK